LSRTKAAKKPLEMRMHQYHFREQHDAIDLSDVPDSGLMIRILPGYHRRLELWVHAGKTLEEAAGLASGKMCGTIITLVVARECSCVERKNVVSELSGLNFRMKRPEVDQVAWNT